MLEDILLKYKNINQIAKSNSSIIYTALDKKTYEKVIIKEFFFDRINNSKESGDISFLDQKSRFEREIDIHSSLEHKNIVKIKETYDKSSELYIVMEYIDGISLQDVLDKNLELGFIELLKIAIQIADVLQYIHDKGIIHRDLKPSNIIVTKNLGAYLIDFGCSKKIYTDKITVSKMLIGTISYMSPEQLISSPETDGRTDIFSLGCILYQLLTGKLPFDGDDPRSTILNLINNEPKKITELNTLVPEKLEKIVLHALKQDQTLRCNTAKILKFHLEKLLEEHEIYQAEGKYLQLKGNYGLAEQFYLKSISIEPNFISFKALGLISYLSKNLKDSLHYYSQAIEYNSSDYEIYEKVGDIYYKLKKYKDAVSMYQKSAILNQNSFTYEIKIAQVLFLSNRVSDSISYYKSILRRDITNIQALYELAIIYYKTGEKNNSMEMLEIAASIDSSNTEILFYLASVYQENLEYQKALVLYEKIEHENNVSNALLQNLACSYYQTGNYKKSKEKIRELEQINLATFQSYILLGLIYENEGNDEKAIESYELAIAEEPDNLGGYLYLSAYLRNTWRLEQAVELLNKATKINTLAPKSEVYYQYAEALREKGLYEEAKKMYKECLVITRAGKFYDLVNAQYQSLFEPVTKLSEKKSKMLFQFTHRAV